MCGGRGVHAHTHFTVSVVHMTLNRICKSIAACSCIYAVQVNIL